MSKLQTRRSGGAKHPEEIVGFFDSALVKASGVFNVAGGGFLVQQESVPAMSVKVNDGGIAMLKKGSGVVYPARIYDGDDSVVITSNSSGNPRIDAIVLYIDLGASPDEDILNVAKLIRVSGTPAGIPVAPSNSDIEASSVGASNPYLRLANVTVANGATSIVNANISDQRAEVILLSHGVPVGNSDILNKKYADDNLVNLLTWNGWQDANETWAIYTENKADGDIDPATDLVTVAVDIKTGTRLVWTSNAPTGLSTNTIYYAIRVSATTIKFASSLANAQAGTGIDITADGSGTRTLNILNFIKIAGVDATGKYQKGDKFKLTNNSVISYHYVLSVTKPASDTIIEITGETWLVYSSAITLPYFSHGKAIGCLDAIDKIQVSVKRTTQQSFNDSTFTKIQLNTEDRDFNGDFDNVTNYRFVAPFGCFISVSGFLVHQGNPTRLIAWIYKNGGQEARGSDIVTTTTTDGIVYTSFVAKSFYVNKGDYVELYGYGVNGNAGIGQAGFSISFSGL